MENREYTKYYLDFDSDNSGNFRLMTIEDRDEVARGNVNAIVQETGAQDWQDALDLYFEKKYGIKPQEWEIG